MDAPKRTCTIEGCDRAYSARGLCKRHYQRWRYHSASSYEPPTLVERLWSKIDKRGPDECWPWMGGKSNGHGMIKRNGRMVQAHRIAYELVTGPIPESHDVHHRCENRACCNPAHLECLTRKQHSERHERSQACAKHPLEDKRRHPSGGRYCASCDRERMAAWRARQPKRT